MVCYCEPVQQIFSLEVPIKKENTAEEELVSIVTKLNSSSTLAPFLKKARNANEGMPLGIALVLQNEIDPFQSGTVCVNTRLSFEEKLSSLLFGLANLINRKKFLEIESKVEKGMIRTAEEYAMAVEEVEYESTKMHAKITSECIKKEGWSPAIDCYGKYHKKEWKTFGGFWEHQTKSGKSERFRKRFTETIGSHVALAEPETLIEFEALIFL